MNMSEKIREVLASASEENPMSSKEVGAKVGLNATSAGVRLSGMLYAKKHRVARVEIGRSATNQPRYGYWLMKTPPPKVLTGVDKKEKPVKSAGALDDMVSSFVDQFADSLVTALVQTLKPRIEAKLREALPQALPQIAPPTQQQTVVLSTSHKRKIGVAGLLPQQAALISQEFGDTFDLRFWNGDTGGGIKQLKSLGIGCEVVYFNTGFCSHSMEATLRSVGAKVVNFGGGMTQLRNLLTKYYLEVAK